MTASVERPVRIGAVSYLNSKPLIEGLRDFAPHAELLLDYPSRLADDLAAGLLDVALIPSVELFRDADYEIISDACVATRGPVLSVKLFSRVPIDEIRRLALDAGSRTSQILVRLMLAERFGLDPEVDALPLGCSTEATAADAILLIGDRAITPPAERFAVTWDLGQEWLDWTGLPFVFAMWAKRRGAGVGDVEQALNRARDLGVERLADIARREAPHLGIDEQTAYSYLKDNLHFHLGSAERNGLRLFRELTLKSGLLAESTAISTNNLRTWKSLARKVAVSSSNRSTP
jgi:chorismate dehydratase